MNDRLLIIGRPEIVFGNLVPILVGPHMGNVPAGWRFRAGRSTRCKSFENTAREHCQGKSAYRIPAGMTRQHNPVRLLFLSE
jgi:hypothetical protein